jgi:hypothetical protein
MSNVEHLRCSGRHRMVCWIEGLGVSMQNRKVDIGRADGAADHDCRYSRTGDNGNGNFNGGMVCVCR